MNDERLFLAGQWCDGETTEEVADKYTGQSLTTMHIASTQQVTRATSSLAEGQSQINLTPYDRFRILARASELVSGRADVLIDAVVDDTGFTVAEAKREVARTADTLSLCAEAARNLAGEMVPLGGAPGLAGRLGFTVRLPLGVVCAITPFNSPLNTVAHKLGPAIAGGNAVILKPANTTPYAATLLIQVLLDAGLPESLIALVNGPGSTVGEALLSDPVPALYAFTGSTAIGEHIRSTVGLRQTQLEMGSLSSTIVCDDADIRRAARLCSSAAFRKAGQVCSSIQRLYVHEAVMNDFLATLDSELNGRVAGDPRSEESFIGPLISEQDAIRVALWVEQAVESGAQIMRGGQRSGSVFQPTVLTDVPPGQPIICQEAFGPVVSVSPFRHLSDAVHQANDTPYGLAAGIFTESLDAAMDAASQLQVGSVHINETSSSRVDLQPYGGTKKSGLGLEGPRYAVTEMTELRLITFGRSTDSESLY